jgi:hypothetical protein
MDQVEEKNRISLLNEIKARIEEKAVKSFRGLIGTSSKEGVLTRFNERKSWITEKLDSLTKIISTEAFKITKCSSLF